MRVVDSHELMRAVVDRDPARAMQSQSSRKADGPNLEMFAERRGQG
jgi:hypothetical protein